MNSNAPSNPGPDDEPPSEKMVLFCQQCSHQSPMGGDWLVSEDDGGYRVLCPECDTVIVAQPFFGVVA